MNIYAINFDEPIEIEVKVFGKDERKTVKVHTIYCVATKMELVFPFCAATYPHRTIKNVSWINYYQGTPTFILN